MKYFLFALLPLFFACQNNNESSLKTEVQDNIISEMETERPDESETADTTIPMDFGLRSIDADQLPELNYEGDFKDCWTWDDKNGVNYLLRAIEQPEMQYPVEDGWEQYDQYLHVYHYTVLANGASSLLRDLTDFVKDCEFDLIMDFIESVELSDIDNDNYGEITFGYRLHCTSDVSPSDQKVLLFENGDKYILRGTSVALDYGGDYTPGDEFDTAPIGFLKKAENFWEEHKVEYALDDNEF